MVKTIKDIDEDFNNFITELSKTKNYDIGKIIEAYEFSKDAHAGQNRETGEPYIMHPLAVAKIVYAHGLDEASIIAALLHDVIEDTHYDRNKVKELFGTEVEIIVDGLTKIITIMESKEERKIETLRKILLASAKDLRVLIIKLCDRLHNIRTLKTLPKEKQERIARETIKIYAPIAQKIGMYSMKWELEDLSFKYRNNEMYQDIKQKIGLKRPQRVEIVNQAVIEIKNILKENGYDDKIKIVGRAKSFYSIYKKLKEKGKTLESIYDLYAIRILTNSISECYTILGFLHEHFQTIPDRLKDYIANPKSNGYQSIHTTLFSKAINYPVEVQIRTEEMHKLAELGIAAHWKYKDLKKDKKFDKKISWLREVMQWENEHQDNLDFLNLLKYDFFQDEIYVFTPKKDLIFLPEGASALDFAYAIHSDVGSKAYKAKINGNIYNIDKILKNGDLVEIITNKTVKPNEKWLKIIKTTKARLKIRSDISLKHSGKTTKESKQEITVEILKQKLTRVNEFKKIRKAGCCKIEYQDQIVGVISKNKELTIHNASCDNAKYTLNPKINLNWIEEKQKEITIDIECKDRYGLIIDILDIISKFNLNVSKLNSKVTKGGMVRIELKVLDGPFIDRLIKKLKSIEGAISVKAIKRLIDKFKNGE